MGMLINQLVPRIIPVADDIQIEAFIDRHELNRIQVQLGPEVELRSFHYAHRIVPRFLR